MVSRPGESGLKTPSTPFDGGGVVSPAALAPRASLPDDGLCPARPPNATKAKMGCRGELEGGNLAGGLLSGVIFKLRSGRLTGRPSV